MTSKKPGEEKQVETAAHGSSGHGYPFGGVIRRAEDGAQKIVSAAASFMKMEASGGIILVIASVVAIMIANSPLYELYDHILHKI